MHHFLFHRNIWRSHSQNLLPCKHVSFFGFPWQDSPFYYYCKYYYIQSQLANIKTTSNKMVILDFTMRLFGFGIVFFRVSFSIQMIQFHKRHLWYHIRPSKNNFKSKIGETIFEGCVWLYILSDTPVLWTLTTPMILLW